MANDRLRDRADQRTLEAGATVAADDDEIEFAVLLE
jgi:hypothetical protein